MVIFTHFFGYCFHLLAVPSRHPIDDLHHQLDREAQQGFSPSAEDARCHAQRGVGLGPDGKGVDGQGSVQQGVAGHQQG